jgi:hypothetical protein
MLAAVALVLWAQPAEAQEFAQVLWSKARAIMAMSLIGYIFVQGGAIFLFAQLLRLEGSIVATLLALLLGMVLSVVAAIPVALVAAILPLFISQLIITASTFACGGLAIKITHSTTFPLGVLVYILATTVTLIATCVALILIF